MRGKSRGGEREGIELDWPVGRWFSRTPLSTARLVPVAGIISTFPEITPLVLGEGPVKNIP